MSLRNYFSKLIKKVEESDQITNGGKDDNGFYKPTRTLTLRNLQLLHDLHDKPRAKPMVKSAWEAVAKDLPPAWLILTEEEKKELRLLLD